MKMGVKLQYYGSINVAWNKKIKKKNMEECFSHRDNVFQCVDMLVFHVKI